MAETMEHQHADVWQMQEQMISLFDRSLFQSAWETDTNKHYGSPKSTVKDKMVI